MQQYDLICIGGGSGGLAAARRAAEYGAKVLVIEAKKLGGTCVNVGCVPKKILWHAGQIADFTHLAKDYGFAELTPTLAYRTFADKRDKFIEKLNGIYQNGLDNANIDIANGYAKFIDNQTIAVGDKHYIAKHIIRELPQSIAIVGAGYIAVELAGVLNALGVETHLIVRKNRFLKQVDDDINSVLTEQMIKDGVNIHFESNIKSITENTSDTDKALLLNLTTDKQLSVETLLWAIGRCPMTDTLGLQNTSVKMHANGDIVIDEQQNSTQSGIYAIGDITRQPTLTPAAIESGRQLAERLFNGKTDAKADFTYVPTVIFSHPAIGTVGLSEKEAIEKYGKDSVKVYQSTFNPLLRSMSEHKVPTRMKMVCVGTDEQVIGVHIIGDFADEIIQGFAVAVQMGANKANFDKTLAIHPTSGEELVTMR